MLTTINKYNMKIQKYITAGILAAGALLLAGSVQVQADQKVLVINTFDSAASGTGVEWGTSTVAWDGTHGNPAGSLLITTSFTGGSDTPETDYMCIGGGNPWWVPVPITFSTYTNVSFDILWDNTSDITIAQFNDISTWPANLTNSLGQTVIQNWGINGSYFSGSITGIDVELCGGPDGQMGPALANPNIPAGAASGWVTVNMPINQGEANIDGCNGIVFHKWIKQCWGIANPAVCRFWVDNVQLEGTQAPPPPPTMTPIVTAVPGLNIFNASPGQYDRHEVLATATSGLTWVSNTPTTYSFDMVGFPKNSIYSTEAYMFLIANAGYEDNAADWNEPNVVILEIQATPAGGQALLWYKTNSPGTGNAPYDMPVGMNNTTNNSVQSTLLLGNYSLTFTGNDTGFVQVPDGTQGSFTLGGTDGETWFAENKGSNYNFLIYLGGQENNASAANQAVVYSSFTLTQNGVPNAISENFVADANATPPALVNWTNGPSSSPLGDVLVPSSALYWVDWSLPAPGYGLIGSPSMNPTHWQPIMGYTPISMSGDVLQLIGPNDLQSPTSAQYFEAVQRAYATSSNMVGSLLVAFPGQTFVNGVGVTGTPTALANNGDLWSPQYGSTSVTEVFGNTTIVQPVGNVYVYAVDASNFLVPITDGVSMYSNPSMGAGFDQTTNDFMFTGPILDYVGETMVGGIATYDSATANYFVWGYAYPPSPAPPTSFMVQVVDYTLQGTLGSANVPAFNSSPVQLNP
jgi:hypothetical protein